MNEPLAQDEKPFSAIDAATELTQLTAELNAAAVRGENTAPILARIEAAAYLQHRRLTNSKIKETLAPILARIEAAAYLQDQQQDQRNTCTSETGCSCELETGTRGIGSAALGGKP